jgi:hypothetical protein
LLSAFASSCCHPRRGSAVSSVGPKKLPHGLFRDRKTNRPALDIRRPGRDPKTPEKRKSPYPVFRFSVSPTGKYQPKSFL